jgi:hypothetical protein
MKKIMLLAVMVTLLAFMVASAANQKIVSSKSGIEVTNKAPMRHYPLIMGDELSLANVPYVPSNPEHIAASPGDTIGFSAFDYQTNGSSGNRVAVDDFGGLHFVWMRAISGLAPRTIRYNYKASPAAPQLAEGTGIEVSISGHVNDGYTQIGITTDNLAVAAYHNGVTESLYVATDGGTGQGFLADSTKSLRMLFSGDAEPSIWPYFTVDRNNRYHIIATEAAPGLGEEQTLGYSRSTNGGVTWTAPAAVDTTMTISGIITSSPVSDKVAIVYTHPVDTGTQWENNIYYVLSQNGTTWDFRNGKVNVTDYETDADSIWAYTDCDAVFDFNDNLHIIWSALGITTDDFLLYLTHIYHYDITSGAITQVMKSDSLWNSDSCDTGGWNWQLAKMSIGADSISGGLFVTATGWYLTDCSNSNFANGEILMSYSTNGGANWTLRGNLTNSQSDDCLAGDCDSDHWSSLAERVDANLHLFYTNDLDAGGIPQTEGSLTNNPMLYYAYPNPIRGLIVPAAPTLVFPEDGQTYGSAFYVFEWSEPVGVVRFEMQVSTNIGFSNIVESNANIYGKEYINLNGLLPGTHYWRVRSIGNYGTSAWSTIDDFIVDYVGIQGHVYESDGSTPIVDAFVAAISTDMVDTSVAATNAAGYYVLPVPGPNTYDLIAGKDGYADTTINDYNIASGVATVNFTLHPPAGGCHYVPGDINGNGSANGIDVTFGVAFFKGGNPPPIDCNPPCTSAPEPFFAAGDVNGNCAFNGIDITFFVAYLKGIQPTLRNCETCPPTP